MKKRCLILFSILLALSLCACSSSADPDSGSTTLTAAENEGEAPDSEAESTPDEDTIRGLLEAAEGSRGSGDYSLVDGHLYQKGKPVDTERTSLMIEGAQLEDYSFLSEFTKLETLDITNSNISDPSVLADLPLLESLVLSGCYGIESYDFLSQLSGLKSFSLRGIAITDLSFLEGLPKLEHLGLSGIVKPEDTGGESVSLDVLQSLKYLSSLDISFEQEQDISQLSALTQLESLSISFPADIDLSLVSDMENITHLSISVQTTNGIDLSPLSNMTKLEYLSLWAMPNPFSGSMSDLEPVDISSLENSASTKTLVLYTNVANCSPIANMTELETLVFQTSNNVDASIFTQLNHLQMLNFTSGSTTNVSALAQADLPDLQTLVLNGTEEDEKLLKDAFPSCNVSVWPADDT